MSNASVKSGRKPKGRVGFAAGFARQCDRLGLYGDVAIAAHIGSDASTVYRVRTGRTQPSTDFIFDTLEAFPGAKCEELFIRKSL